MENITLYNRQTQDLEEEIITGKALMRLMYASKTGLFLTNKILKKKRFSFFYGNLLKKKSSKKRIEAFIKQHKIDTDEILNSIDSFDSFNDFFIRKLKSTARPIDQDKSAFISPADSRLMAYNLNEETVITLKGLDFTLRELVLDEKICNKYLNGVCLVFRLAPADYHRLCYVDNGFQNEVRKIGEYFHSVHPIALQSNMPVFQGNYREMCELKTENFQEILWIDVGALGVSKIVQNNPNATSFKKGEEKGYFEFGGSTTILILKPNIVKIDSDILDYASIGIETKVKYGETIGVKIGI